MPSPWGFWFISHGLELSVTVSDFTSTFRAGGRRKGNRVVMTAFLIEKSFPKYSVVV